MCGMSLFFLCLPGFLQILWSPPTVQNHVMKLTGDSELASLYKEDKMMYGC